MMIRLDHLGRTATEGDRPPQTVRRRANTTAASGTVLALRSHGHALQEGDAAMATPTARSQSPTALSAPELSKLDALWRASNYLSVGQIYLLDNPLLRKPLAREHIKPRLLGHWGTTPGLNFLYAHLNRVDQEARPGHDLRHRPGARRPGAGRARLPRGDLQRGLPEHQPGRGGDEAALQAVQLPGRHPQPRGPGDARLDPRGRRARLRAVARVSARRSTTPI